MNITELVKEKLLLLGIFTTGKRQSKVNGKDYNNLAEYLRGNDVWVLHALKPLEVTDLNGQFDSIIRANGGGLSGQVCYKTRNSKSLYFNMMNP